MLDEKGKGRRKTNILKYVCINIHQNKEEMLTKIIIIISFFFFLTRFYLFI